MICIQVTLPSYLITSTSKQEGMRAWMHASCRPYVSVVSCTTEEFICFPASGIDHVGCVGYQGRLSYYNGGCCISCFVCLQTVVGMVFMGPPLPPHNGRKGRGNITSISLSKGFPPPSVPNCHFCFGNAAGHSPGVVWCKKMNVLLQSTIQLESTIQTKTRSR